MVNLQKINLNAHVKQDMNLLGLVQMVQIILKLVQLKYLPMVKLMEQKTVLTVKIIILVLIVKLHAHGTIWQPNLLMEQKLKL